MQLQIYTTPAIKPNIPASNYTNLYRATNGNNPGIICYFLGTNGHIDLFMWFFLVSLQNS